MAAVNVPRPMADNGLTYWGTVQAASDCWWRPGHPGWSIWPADSEQFIRSVLEAGNTILSPVQIVAPVPKTPHNKHAAPGMSSMSLTRCEDALWQVMPRQACSLLIGVNRAYLC